ncbi:MAG: aminotransferase class III-fold pyridoxal phosphate-dependent enzyme [bacterium]
MLKDKSNFNPLDLLDTEKEESPFFPLSILVKRAEGCCLFDENDNKYIDFTSNRENQPFGYSKININPDYSFFDSILCNSNESLKLKKYFQDLTGLEEVYFSSSQRESYVILNNLIEDYLNKVRKTKMLVSSTNQDFFKINNIKIDVINLNVDTTTRSVFTRDVGVVIIEPVQINNGILIANNEYLKYMRYLCDKNDAVLVFDVSSISPLRLLKSFLNYDISIKPDILIVSKGMSQGIPFGAVVVSDKISGNILKNPETGTNSLAYELALKFIDDYKNNELTKIISDEAKYFEKKLNELAENHISIVDVQSYGMLFFVVLDISAYELANGCFSKGIILEPINSNTIMLSPSYITGMEEIDHLSNVLDNLLDKLANFDRLH